MIRSLRLRLLLSTSLASAVILGLLGLGIYFSMRRSLLAEFDAALSTQARVLTLMARQGGRGVTFDFNPQQLPEFAASEHPEYFQVWLEDGKVLARSPSMGTGDFFASGPASERPVWATADGVCRNTILPDGQPGRAMSLAVTPVIERRGPGRFRPDERRPDDRGDRPGWRFGPRPPSMSPWPPRGPATAPVAAKVILTVARHTEEMDKTLAHLRWLLLSLCGGAVVMSGAVLMAVVGRAVRPLNRVARQIEALRETNLASRLSPAGVPKELVPVVETLNGLLGRLQGAFEREKALAADVAHELRTPLAGLRATLDVCLARPRDAKAYETTLEKCRGMTLQMQALVESLLLLARAEAGQLVVEKAPFELAPLLEECWLAFDARATQRQLHVEWETAPEAFVEADRDKLRIVLNNLLDNAVSYADANGTIRLKCGRSETQSWLEIANTGSQVDAADAAHLFERFWRGDQARTGTESHCGLGLSLCHRLITLLGGTITAETSKGDRFVTRITLPTAVGPVTKELLEVDAV